MGGSGEERLGLLRAIISSGSADLPIKQAGLPPTQGVGKMPGRFLGYAGLDRSLTYNLRPVPAADCMAWGSSSSPAAKLGQGWWRLLGTNGD